jgi:hypothetical protein
MCSSVWSITEPHKSKTEVFLFLVFHRVSRADTADMVKMNASPLVTTIKTDQYSTEWLRTRKDVDRRNRRESQRNISAFVWKGLVKQRKMLTRTVSLRAQIWIWELPNTKQWCQLLDN